MNYGEFEIPENARIEAVSDPIKDIMLQYEIWKQTVNMEFLQSSYFYFECVESAYNSTQRLPDVTEAQLQELLQQNVDSVFDIYASALFNSSSMTTLCVQGNRTFFGFRLAKGKTIINNGHIEVFGMYAEGNTINNGTTNLQAYRANGGIHVNNKTGDTLGSESRKTTTINTGRVDNQATQALSGVHLNLDKTKRIGYFSKDNTLVIGKAMISADRYKKNNCIMFPFPEEQELLTELKQYCRRSPGKDTTLLDRVQGFLHGERPDTATYIATMEKYVRRIRQW